MDDNVREMMFLIVEQLKAYVDGNEDALLELTRVLDSGHHDADVVNQAFEMIFRALEPYSREDYPGEARPTHKHVRVPTGPERALLSSPAYTYFFRLSESGRVTPEQFEEIMARARDEGGSLDSEAKAEELATEVLIHWFDEEHGIPFDPGATQTAH
jgi:hypothetical protein